MRKVGTTAGRTQEKGGQVGGGTRGWGAEEPGNVSGSPGGTAEGPVRW